MGCGQRYQVGISFDKVNHEWMIKFLRHRIGDERVMRLIIRMLKSGILEEGLLHATEEGTPGIYPFAAAVEHLPALCAGPVVQCAGEQAEPGGRPIISVLPMIFWPAFSTPRSCIKN